MSLSANTLFHFTSFESLKGILENGFYPSCSIEQQYFGEFVTPIAIPMVSFCDIRLTQIKDHIQYYQPYGIGIKKEWGIKKGINPVFYILKDSYPLLAARKILIETYLERMKVDKLSFQSFEFLQTYRILQLFCFFKHNLSQRWDKKKLEFSDKAVDFYDEREWRFVSELYTEKQINEIISKSSIPLAFISATTYDKNDLKQFAEEIEKFNKILKLNPLTFLASDIKYLVVETEEEVKELVKFLSTSPRHKDSPDLELLYSKITTIKNIEQDH